MKQTKRWIGALAALAILMSATGCASGRIPDEDVVPEADFTAEGWSYSDGLDENGLWAGVDASSLVTLPNYKEIKIPAEEVAVTDEEVEAQISTLLSEYTSPEKITDRAVADGDTVNIDFVGSVDGVEFEGGSTGGRGTAVTIGVTNYIDDFLEQLIGHMPGETVRVEVTFPEDYGKDDLNGKDAVFVTVINYIVGDAQTPALTDAFVAENFGADYGWTTVDAMRAGVRQSLETSAFNNWVNGYLTSGSDFASVPESMIEYQQKSVVRYCESTAEYLNVDLKTFFNYYAGVSTANELLTARAEAIENSAKLCLAVQAIAEAEGLVSSEEDVAAYFAETKDGADYNDYAAFYGMPYMKWSVCSERVLELIRETAVVG